MNLSRDNSNYGTSSTKSVLHRDTPVDDDTNEIEDPRAYYSQRAIPKKSSDRFCHGEMERVVKREQDTYSHKYDSTRHKSSKNEDVAWRSRKELDYSYDGRLNDYNNEAPVDDVCVEPSNSRHHRSRYFCRESYRYTPRQDHRFQYRNSSRDSPSSSSPPPSILRSESRTDNMKNQIYDTCQCYEPRGELVNNTNFDHVYRDYDSDEPGSWDKSPHNKYGVEKTSSCIQSVDNDDSYFDRKMPAKPKRSQLTILPSTSCLDQTIPAKKSDQKTIEISPGCVLPLRGANETWNAVLNDFYKPHQCVCCEVTVFCIQDAAYLLCPICRVINPLPEAELNEGRGGVGLGFLIEDLADWQSKIAKERKF